MNAEESKLILKEENGEEKEYYKLFTFDSKKQEKVMLPIRIIPLTKRGILLLELILMIPLVLICP